MSSVAPRVIVVTRPTELEALIARHGTRAQARFFLDGRGQSMEAVEARHLQVQAALGAVQRAVPLSWRRARLDRSDLSRWVFEPADVVVAVGQDGLVPNVAKYLDGQLVVGVNPDPGSWDGVLVRHRAKDVEPVLHAAVDRSCRVQERTMVEAVLDDGQRILALNEVFVGHRTHQSARYRIGRSGREERQSSSGLIAATGTGATGWARSILRQRRSDVTLPACGDRSIAYLVREAFPSVSTGTAITEGVLSEGDRIEIVSEMNDGGVVFGDGIEDDRLELGWGVRACIRVAPERLRLVV